MLTSKTACQASRITFFCISVFLSHLHAQVQKESSISPARPIAGAPQAAAPMGMNTELVAPLVIESSDWSSVVTLVNESKNQIHAQLALRAIDGELVAANTVVLPGHSSRRVAVESLFHGVDFIGFLTVNVQEMDAAQNMAVAAQLTLIGKGNLIGTSIDQELEMPKMGSNFKSVVDSSSALLAIQNAGMQTAPATVTCIIGGAVTHTSTQVPPGRMLLLHNCETLNDDLTSASHLLSTLAVPTPGIDSGSAFEVDGGSSELTVFGLSFPLQHNHPISAATFINQSDFTSQSTVFAGIPVGAYIALPGAVFEPTLTLANLSQATRIAIVRAASNDSLQPAKLVSTVTLQPFEVRRLDIPFENPAGSAIGTFLVDQDGAPGDVLANLMDKDKATQTTLNPLPKFLHHANNGGGHPWSVEPGTSSTIVIFNASAKEQTLNFNLGADGIVWKKTVMLQANQTLSMDVQGIIAKANEQSSSKSNSETKPQKITALTGEISWFTPNQADVFGRVLLTREQAGRRALESYSCGNNIVLCSTGVYPSFVAIDYLSTGFLGLTPQFCASWSPQTCSGTQYGGGSASSYSWQSQNNSITPISGSSSNSNVGLYGQALGSGGANGFVYAGSCQASGGGGAQVLSLSCSSPVTRGSSTTCTIQGGGGATGSNWQFKSSSGTQVSGPSSGTTWSGTMVTSGTVSVAATYKGNTTTVSASITVTPRSSGFTVAAPVKPYPASPSPNGTPPMATLTSPPTGEEGTFGQSAYNYNYTFNSATISGGPNGGYSYITSFSDSSVYIFELNPGLTNRNDPFYTHQYGNCGIPSAIQIASAVRSHEVYATPSHYSEVAAALNNNNPGPAAEAAIAAPNQSIQTIVNQTVKPIYQSAVNAGNVEPPTNLPAILIFLHTNPAHNGIAGGG